MAKIKVIWNWCKKSWLTEAALLCTSTLTAQVAVSYTNFYIIWVLYPDSIADETELDTDTGLYHLTWMQHSSSSPKEVSGSCSPIQLSLITEMGKQKLKYYTFKKINLHCIKIKRCSNQYYYWHTIIINSRFYFLLLQFNLEHVLLHKKTLNLLKFDYCFYLALVTLPIG